MNVVKRVLLCAVALVVSSSYLQPLVGYALPPIENQVLSGDQKKIFDSKVNYYEVNGCGLDGGASTPTAAGSENLETIFNYMLGKGLSREAAAGVVGNISQESGGDPENIQEPGGRTKDPSGVSSGWGIIQWTPGNKVIDLVKTAGVSGKIYDLNTQLELLWWHMITPSSTPTGATFDIESFKKITDFKQAVDYFEDKIEGAGKPAIAARYDAARLALDNYKGGPPADAGATTDDACSCDISDGPGATVVLDPGHSGNSVEETDPDSGIKTSDYNNTPEISQVWETSEKVRKTLEDKGYKVVVTKKNEQDSVGLIERSRIANAASAAIAVSIHNTPGKFGSASSGWVVPQETGQYRQTGTHKKVFEDEEVAEKSQNYADDILAERKKTEGDAQIHGLDFPPSRGLGTTGNIAIVQLFSKIPWVYNEVGQSGFDADKYAKGIADGITKALGPPAAGATGESGARSPDCGSGVPGDLTATIKAYAWPDYHAAPYLNRRPAYANAVTKAKKEGLYIGGTVNGVEGIDCGGFVTRVMLDSGYEPKYNSSGKGGFTGSPGDPDTQWGWLDKNWQKVNPQTTGDVHPGDVAINSEHTYVYVGQVDGFNSKVASASFSTSGNGRAPMAGHEKVLDSSFHWYRKK